MSREIPCGYTEPVLSRYIYRDTVRLYRTGFIQICLERYRVTKQNRVYPDMSREIPCDYTETVLSRCLERYHATTQNRLYPDMSREIPCDYTEPVLSRYV